MELSAAVAYARQKLNYCRLLYPDTDCYDNDYLIELARGCLREQVAAQYTERRFKNGRNQRAYAFS